MGFTPLTPKSDQCLISPYGTHSSIKRQGCEKKGSEFFSYTEYTDIRA